MIAPDNIAPIKGLIIKNDITTIDKSKIKKNTALVLKNSKKNRVSPRAAAMKIAKARVLKACKTCRA